MHTITKNVIGLYFLATQNMVSQRETSFITIFPTRPKIQYEIILLPLHYFSFRHFATGLHLDWGKYTCTKGEKLAV